MMSVFREVEITWRGEPYTVTPSNALLRRIGQTVSIGGLMYDMHEGKIPLPEMSCVLAELLKSGGAKITEDDVYQEMIYADEDVKAHLAEMLVYCITPKEPEGKKPEPPAPKRKKVTGK